jgi:cell division septum initiation protein DivIVA
MLYKQQDNALLLQRINSLKAENVELREQVRQFTATQDSLQQDLAQPAAVDSAPANSGLASGS